MNKENLRTLKKLRQRNYFEIVENKFNNTFKKKKDKYILDRLTDIMQDCLPEINTKLDKRKSDGEIKDVDQARKSIAGNAFQALVVLTLISLQEKDIIDQNLVFSLKPKENRIIKEYAERRDPETRFRLINIFWL